jgi:anti-anti-sigma factor
MQNSERTGNKLILAEHTQKNVLYLKFSGISRLNHSTAEAMKVEIEMHMKNCCKNIFIDLANIHFIDAKSFEELASLSNTAKENGINLTLCNVSDETFDLISVMQLEDVLVSSGHPYEIISQTSSN